MALRVHLDAETSILAQCSMPHLCVTRGLTLKLIENYKQKKCFMFIFGRGPWSSSQCGAGRTKAELGLGQRTSKIHAPNYAHERGLRFHVYKCPKQVGRDETPIVRVQVSRKTFRILIKQVQDIILLISSFSPALDVFKPNFNLRS